MENSFTGFTIMKRAGILIVVNNGDYLMLHSHIKYPIAIKRKPKLAHVSYGLSCMSSYCLGKAKNHTTQVAASPNAKTFINKWYIVNCDNGTFIMDGGSINI